MPRKKSTKLNEKMAVYIVAPHILGPGIYKAYAKKISSPSKDGSRAFSFDVDRTIKLRDLAEDIVYTGLDKQYSEGK